MTVDLDNRLADLRRTPQPDGADVGTIRRGAERRTRRRRAVIGTAATLAVIVGIVGIVALDRDDTERLETVPIDRPIDDGGSADPEPAPDEPGPLRRMGDVEGVTVAVSPRTDLADGALVEVRVEGLEHLPDALILMCTGDVDAENATTSCDTEAVQRPDTDINAQVTAEAVQTVSIGRVIADPPPPPPTPTGAWPTTPRPNLPGVASPSPRTRSRCRACSCRSRLARTPGPRAAHPGARNGSRRRRHVDGAGRGRSAQRHVLVGAVPDRGDLPERAGMAAGLQRWRGHRARHDRPQCCAVHLRGAHRLHHHGMHDPAPDAVGDDGRRGTALVRRRHRGSGSPTDDRSAGPLRQRPGGRGARHRVPARRRRRLAAGRVPRGTQHRGRGAVRLRQRAAPVVVAPDGTFSTPIRLSDTLMFTGTCATGPGCVIGWVIPHGSTVATAPLTFDP